MKNNKQTGITLVALVITVILMLILAGIAISAIVGNDGLIEKIIESAKTYNNSAENEAEVINYISTNEFFNGEKPGPIEVPDLTEENVTFTYLPTEWTNGQVEVEIQTNITGYTLQYSLDNGENWIKYVGKIKVSDNKQVILARLEKRGYTGEVASGNVINIDKIAPKLFVPTVENIKETEFTMVSNTEDGEETEVDGKSGIEKYEFYVESQLYKTVIASDSNKVVITERTSTTTYKNCYVVAYDKAGNHVESEHINITTKAPGIPITDPGIKGGQYVEYAAGGYNQWRILTNDGTTVTLISVGSPKTQYLYGRDGTDNGIAYLNNACQAYINPTLAASARNAKLSDANAMNAIGAVNIGSRYWLADRHYYSDEYEQNVMGGLAFVTESGAVCSNGLVGETIYVLIMVIPKGEGPDYYGYTYGIRPIITLKPGVKIIGGAGTNVDKYRLGV